MKTKEVCGATGLTRKTVMFYEEQGFVSPEKTRLNGREYRNWSDSDIGKLRNVATLRKAAFSIDEIKRMQESDGAVKEIFAGYRERLLARKAELDGLVAVVEGISAGSLACMEDLVERLRAPSDALQLPQADREPHFLYLDDLEAELSPKEPAFHTDRRPVSIDEEYLLNTRTLGCKKMLDDLKEDLSETVHTGVPEPAGGPLWPGLVKAAAGIVFGLFFFDMMAASGRGAASAWFLRDIAVLLGAAGVFAGATLLQKWLRNRK